MLSADEVSKWAEKFGLCTSEEGRGLALVKELPSYDDLNFHIKTHDGSEYVLKAHNGFIESGTDVRLLAQNRFIDKLHASGLPVPSVIATRDGVTMLHMGEIGAAEANQKAHVRVLTYLKGDIVPNKVPKSADFLHSVGELCGRLTCALERFEDDAMKWDWEWNMKNVASVCTAQLKYVLDKERRAIAEKFIASYAKALNADVIAKLPHSVIHSDLNDTNLLFRDSSVVGVLDFGDSIYSCTIFELGIAAGYYSLDQQDPLWVFGEVLRGYLTQRQLSDLERSVFYHAAYGRVLLSVCMSAKSCAAEPDNEYLAHTSEPGWKVLQTLSSVTPDDALKHFQSIANAEKPRSCGENKRSKLDE